MIRWLVKLTTGSLICLMAFSPAGAQQPPAPAPETTPPIEPAPEQPRPSAKFVIPEPSIIPLSWQLNLSYQAPMRMVVTPPGQKQAVHYWYILYTITNPGPREVDYLPRVQMMTDELELLDAQMVVNRALFESIRKLHKAPYLEDPLQVTGKILAGADNARDSVALFALKKDPQSFRVFFCGLSGEEMPWTIPPTGAGGQPETVMLEKVRVLEFQVVGRVSPDKLPTVVQDPQEGDRWVMRLRPPKSKLDVDLKAPKGEWFKDESQPVKPPPAEPPTPEPTGPPAPAEPAPLTPQAPEQPAKQPTGPATQPAREYEK